MGSNLCCLRRGVSFDVPCVGDFMGGGEGRNYYEGRWELFVLCVHCVALVAFFIPLWVAMYICVCICVCVCVFLSPKTYPL